MSVPVASVHAPGSPVLSFSWNTHACTAPVTLSGAVPFKNSCGSLNISVKSECESNRPARAWSGQQAGWAVELD